MCGICGKIYMDTSIPVNGEEIVRMCNTMINRGPDAGGIYLDRHAGLGHRRLSIIDLQASVQPMSNENDTVWIVYNGEVYNFLELRHDLISRGHKFRTSGDTEVIIHLYEEFGQDCVTLMRGMFSFAIWDGRTDTLFLARDRIGIKPLYYTLDDKAFLFGSELKALLADRHFRNKREIDPDAVHSYLSFLCIPDPVCIYRNVKKLPAGHTLTLRDGRIQLRRYWNVMFREEDKLSQNEWDQGLIEQLREAVRVRLVADVPLGAFLSGGIDSSTVVALMTELMDRPVKTFSIGFSEKTHNEASDARLVANHLKTDHTELILMPAEARSVIPNLIEYFDEPFADSSAIPTYYVSKLAREQVTVVLSGDGGDELFGGYPWRQVRPSYQLLLNKLPMPVRVAIRQLSGLLPAGLPGLNFLRRVDRPYNRYILDAMAVFDDEDRCGLYGPLMTQDVMDIDPYRHHLPHLTNGGDRSWEERMMEYDLKTYLPNDILTKVDRMSMFNSLEARVPLLDHQLVEMAAVIPRRFKINRGIGKQILKRVIAPYLPNEVIEKRKHGFSIPIETWLRTVLKEDVLDTLRGGNQHGFFDRQTVDKITQSFYNGDDTRNHQVWALYVFEHWYRSVHNNSRRK